MAAHAGDLVVVTIPLRAIDGVDVGRLADSGRIEPGTPDDGPQLDAPGLTAALQAAERPAR